LDARFRDHNEAGQLLAAQLAPYANRLDVLAISLPRGGVPVAAQVIKALHVPMDICLVRKLGVSGHEELAMGAIASGRVRVLNDNVLSRLHISR
jgi:putative phosphoribosyl transferase